jgi:hypothetical protein
MMTAEYKLGTDTVEVYQDMGEVTYALNGIAVIVRRGDMLNIHQAANIQCGTGLLHKMMHVMSHAAIDAAAWKRARTVTEEDKLAAELTPP